MGVEGLWYAVKPWAKPGNLFKLCTQACIGLDTSLLLCHYVNALRHERFRACTMGEMRSHVVQSIVGCTDKLTGRGMSSIHVLDGLKNPAKVVAQSKRANVTQTLQGGRAVPNKWLRVKTPADLLTACAVCVG